MPASRRLPSLLRDLLVGLLPLLLLTLYFRIDNADIRWSLPWREAGEWTHGGEIPWSWLYHFGTYPALLAALAALAVLLGGFRVARLAAFRRHALFVILLLATGPGLITNAVLKDHWGRPRPRDVCELGGTYPYEPLLTIDPSSPGKSFPCGHATMGFFFFAGYFLLRGHRPAAARACLVGALTFGLAIGWARVVQGGHFPSDVVWAGGVVWLTAAILAHLAKLDHPPAQPSPFVPLSWNKLSAAFLLVPALVFLVLLATPMDQSVSYTTASIDPARPLTLRLQIPLGETRITPAETLTISSRSHGFGLPGGGIKSVWKPDDPRPGSHEFKQRRSGLQTELNQSLHVTVPSATLDRLHLTQPVGTVFLQLPATPPTHGPRRWILDLQQGSVHLTPGPLPYQLKHGDTTSGPDDAADVIELRTAPDVPLLTAPAR